MIRGKKPQTEELEPSSLRLSSGGKAATSRQTLRAVSLRQVLETLGSYLYAGIFTTMSREMQQ